jgi:uncharacterized UPF0146 family protein
MHRILSELDLFTVGDGVCYVQVADSLRSYGVVVRLVDVVENSPQSARKTLAKFHKLGHMQS